MRGFGGKGRCSQVKDFVQKDRIDIVFLQETMRQDFSDQDLKNLECGDKFLWSWRPAAGRSGGMLLGIRDSTLEVGQVDQGQFFLSVSIYHRAAKFKIGRASCRERV